MGRTERELVRDAGPLERFAWDLRQLREAAGRPGYRELAARVHFSASTLSEAASGRVLPSLAVTRAYVRGCGGPVEVWVRRWHQVRRELATAVAETTEGAGEPPYLGLAAFGPGDADRFFGRRQLTDELVKRVADTPVVALLGASGSGKSSVLRAGLAPRLEGAGVLFTPGAEPFRRLLAVLAHPLGPTGDGVVPEPPGDDEPDQVLAAVRRLLAARPAAERVTVLVDQFEEVFTLCRDPQLRERFVDVLLTLAESDDRVRVVLAIRADFYAHCARQAALVPVLRDAQVLVGPLIGTDLREAITGPAEQAGWRVEPAVVEAIEVEATDCPGALPLVSHALLETWQRRQGRTLTLAGYHAAGGLTEAVSRTAERIYTGLDARQQGIAKDLFLRLTALGEGTDHTRRRVPYAELSDDDAVRDVLDRLVAARLITCDTEEVSVAHEALIRRWSRLQDWLAADREQLLAHRRLTEATTEWEQHGRDEAFLYRGRRLDGWNGRPVDRLNPAETAFLAAGRRLRDRETAARRRRSRRWVAVLAAVTVAVTVLGLISIVQARRAVAERDQALADQLAAGAREQLSLHPEQSLLLARRALAIRQTPAAWAALRQAVVDDRVRSILATGLPQVFGVAYRPDGNQVATSGDTGTVRLWDLAPDGSVRGPVRELTGHVGEVWSPVFSPDGRLLAACGVDGTVTVWDLATGSAPRVLRGHTGKVWRVAFSSDGRRLASTSDDGTVRIWDPSTGAPVRTVAHTPARQLGLAYSPDGRHLAAGDSDGLIRVWDTTGSAAPIVLRGHTKTVQNLAWTLDSGTLVSAGTDGTARVWHLGPQQGDPVVLHADGAGTIETVAVSPDGTRVAAAGSDGTVRVYGITGQDDPLVLPGHEGTVWTLAFSPHGNTLLSGGGDGTARFWDAAYPGNPQVLRGPAGVPLDCVATSTDGQLLVTGGDDGEIRIWRPGTPGGAPVVLRGHRGPVLSVAVGPGGTRIASGGTDGTVRIWDISSGRAEVLDGHGGKVFGVAFLPDRRRIASAEGSGLVRIWDLRTGTSVALHGHDGTARSVVASPDGRRLASTGRDGTVRIWDLSSHRSTVLTGHRAGLVWQAAFSPDGRRLATSGDDGTVRIWDVAGSSPPVVLRGHRGSVWTVAYSPDGQFLVSGGADGGLRIWQAATATLLATVHGYGSPVDQAVFGPATTWIATVHDDGTLRLSHCDVCGSLPQLQAQAAALVPGSPAAGEQPDAPAGP